jgi:DNA-binding GntR family transcriptional regulator
VLDEFEDALRAGEATRWGPLNWHFHAALYAPASRNFTMGVLQKLHQHSDRYFRMQVLLANGGSRANDEHRAIAAAVQAKDVPSACELMRAHILGAGTSLLALVEDQRGKHGTPVRSIGP